MSEFNPLTAGGDRAGADDEPADSADGRSVHVALDIPARLVQVRGGDGSLNTQNLTHAPQAPGVYAIASKKSTGLYVTHYVGRSKNIRERLRRHFTGHGNSIIASQLALKKSVPLAPASLCFAYLETSEPKIVEAVYLDTHDLAICNFIRARLPFGLTEALVHRAELER